MLARKKIGLRVMNRRKVGKKIKEYRLMRGLTQQELAEMIGTTAPTISKYEQGKRGDFDMLAKIAEALQIPFSVLFEDSEVQPINLPKPIKTVPLFDTEVSAGNGSFPEAFQPIELIPVDRKDVDYAFRMRGRSMEPELFEDDIVIVKAMPTTEVKDGDLVVAIYDNHFFVKRIHFVDSQIVLLSENDEYLPIIVDPNTRFEVIGKVIEIRRVPRRKRFRRG